MLSKTIILDKDTTIKVTKDAQYILIIEPDTKHFFNLIFEKEGAEAEVIGLFKLDKNQNLDLITNSTHLVPHTSCNVHIWGILEDRSVSRYFGKITINKKAQQTSSFLDNKVLVLGEDTKNFSDPVLQIEANDVKASHSSTTGRIDEGKIFYLMSRGLSAKEAKYLCVDGFFGTLLARIKDEKIRRKVLKNIL